MLLKQYGITIFISRWCATSPQIWRYLSCTHVGLIGTVQTLPYRGQTMQSHVMLLPQDFFCVCFRTLQPQYDEVCTMPIRSTFQNGTVFRTAHNVNLKRVSGCHTFQNGTHHRHVHKGYWHVYTISSKINVTASYTVLSHCLILTIPGITNICYSFIVPSLKILAVYLV